MWIASHAGPFELIELEVNLGLPFKLKVLHISDLHFAPGQKAKAGFLRELAETQPDLVINTGDNLGHRDAINPTLEALGALLDYPGVFVNGSNDYRAPKPRNPINYFLSPSEVSGERNLDTKRFTKELEGAGWLNLNNRSGALSIEGQSIGFLGLDDPHEALDDLDSLSTQRKEIAQADLVLGVAHAPYLRVIEGLMEHGADMVFAGHTHGGQICLPGKKALVTNCDLPTEYAQGLSAWQHGGKVCPLHVSGGLGCSIYAPVRLFCPPSATLITLA